MTAAAAPTARLRIVATLLVLSVFLADAGASQPQVRVSGRTMSDTAAPVAGAEVVVRKTAGGPVIAHVVSDAAGAFTLEVAEPGVYVVSVERQGFFTIDNQAVELAAGGSIVLTLETMREHLESLEVTSRGDPVGLTQTGTEKALSGAEAMNIPFEGSHSVKNALRTLPGVVQDVSSGVHVDGARESQTLFVFDGFTFNDPLTGGFDPRVSVEAVQSLTVRSGVFPAEFGRGSGGVVEIATHIGGDRLRWTATDFFPTLINEHGLVVQDWTPRVSISGPVVKGRAWFSNSFLGDYSQYFVDELPDGEDSSASWRLSNHTRGQFNLARTNVLHVGFLASGGLGKRLGLTPLDPIETTRDARTRQWFAHVRDQHYFASGLVLETGYASNRTSLQLIPRGTEPYISTPTGRSGNYYYDGTQRSSRDQVIANVYVPSFSFAGSHQIKAGLDLNRVSWSQDATRGQIHLLDGEGRPIRSITYIGSGVVETTNRETAGFVQDSWSVHPRLALQIGARSDWDALTGDWTVSPRASAAWSPSDSGSTKVSGGFAINYDATRLQLFAAAEDQVPVSVYFPPYGSGAPVVSRFEADVDTGYDSPRFQTWTFAFDRRLPEQVYLHLQALRRRGTNALAYVGTPQRDEPSLYTLTNSRTDAYDSAEMTLRQRFGRDYSWLAGYTYSSARSGAVYAYGPDNYYVAADNSGPMSWDTPHRFVSWAYLPTFRKPWSFSYLLEYRSGFPWSVSDSAGFVLGSVNSQRFPTYFDLTVGLERRTRLFGQWWAIRGTLNNVTNHHNPTTVNGIVESPEFGTFYGGQRRTLAGRVRWLGK